MGNNLTEKEFWEAQKRQAEIDKQCAKNLIEFCEKELKKIDALIIQKFKN